MILEHEKLETELWKEAKEISFTDTFTNTFLLIILQFICVKFWVIMGARQ